MQQGASGPPIKESAKLSHHAFKAVISMFVCLCLVLQEGFAEAEDDELLDEVAHWPHEHWGLASKLSSVVKRAVKLWVNEQRTLAGEKPVHQVRTSTYQNLNWFALVRISHFSYSVAVLVNIWSLSVAIETLSMS